MISPIHCGNQQRCLTYSNRNDHCGRARKRPKKKAYQPPSYPCTRPRKIPVMNRYWMPCVRMYLRLHRDRSTRRERKSFLYICPHADQTAAEVITTRWIKYRKRQEEGRVRTGYRSTLVGVKGKRKENHSRRVHLFSNRPYSRS